MIVTLLKATLNRQQQQQPSAPPTPLVNPDYPFQCLCIDFFHYKGVVVDRYSSWPIVGRAANGASGLGTFLRRIFVTFGFPMNCQLMVARNLPLGLHDSFWNRLFSVALLHSNCRTEVGVKTVKRLITGNTAQNGDLDTGAFQHAILQYRNTPDRDTKPSPTMCVLVTVSKTSFPSRQVDIDLTTHGVKRFLLGRRHCGIVT